MRLSTVSTAGCLAGSNMSQPAQYGQRIWDDATYGTLSSDGSRVFVIEELPLGVTAPYGRFRFGVSGRNDPSNRGIANQLAAYDIHTGKLQWELGGRGGVAAERYFFPRPAAASPRPTLRDGRDQGRNATLGPGWGDGQSPLVAAVGHGRVEHHARSGSPPGRRFAVLQRRRLGLSHRCRLRGSRRPGNPLAPLGLCLQPPWRTGCGTPHAGESDPRTPSYNANGPVPRWLDGTATIVNGRVLLTPAEADALYCLNLADGKPAVGSPAARRALLHRLRTQGGGSVGRPQLDRRRQPGRRQQGLGWPNHHHALRGRVFAATAVMPAGNTSCRSGTMYPWSTVR